MRATGSRTPWRIAPPTDCTGPRIVAAKPSSTPLSTLLTSIELDPLTVADDPNFLHRIATEPNVPAAIRDGLALLYRRRAPAARAAFNDSP